MVYNRQRKTEVRYMHLHNDFHHITFTNNMILEMTDAKCHVTKLDSYAVVRCEIKLF